MKGAGLVINIQIFGKRSCFDTKKAERFFKERRIKYQYIDLPRFGMSRGELKSVAQSVGIEALIDENAPGVELLRYLARYEDRLEKLFEEPAFIKTPVVRNGKSATVGHAPGIWQEWINKR